jgi:hypothetical protein
MVWVDGFSVLFVVFKYRIDGKASKIKGGTLVMLAKFRHFIKYESCSNHINITKKTWYLML